MTVNKQAIIFLSASALWGLSMWLLSIYDKVLFAIAIPFTAGILWMTDSNIKLELEKKN
jgi:hypothetical protein